MKTKFYSIVAFIITFGSYPQTGIRVYSSHDGGFENHATGNVQGGFTSAISLSTTTWSASTTSSTAIIRTISATGGRTGPQCASFGSLSTTQKFFYSQVIAGTSFAPNTKYQIQFFYKPTTTTATLASNKSIEIYDVLGKKVFSTSKFLDKVDISSVKTGIYMARIKTDKGT